MPAALLRLNYTEATCSMFQRFYIGLIWSMMLLVVLNHVSLQHAFLSFAVASV